MSETATPGSKSPSAPSDIYHTALVRALIFQVFFVLLASLILDGGTTILKGLQNADASGFSQPNV